MAAGGEEGNTLGILYVRVNSRCADDQNIFRQLRALHQEAKHAPPFPPQAALEGRGAPDPQQRAAAAFGLIWKTSNINLGPV